MFKKQFKMFFYIIHYVTIQKMHIFFYFSGRYYDIEQNTSKHRIFTFIDFLIIRFYIHTHINTQSPSCS